MDPKFTTIQIILFLGAAQGIVLSIVLATIRKEKNLANKLLSTILLIFSVSILVHVLSHGANLFSHVVHEIILTNFFMLIGPLFLFYIEARTQENFKMKRTEYLQFLPFFICVIIVSLSVIFSLFNFHFIIGVCTGFLAVHLTFYITLTFNKLKSHSNKIKESFSSIEEINFKWLRLFMAGFLITWLFAMIFDLISALSDKWDYVWLLISLFLYLVGYAGLRQPVIFSILPELKDTTARKKYEKSTLSIETADIYYDKIKNFMIETKPYLNNNLTLPELSDSLSMPVHHLSQIINERFNKNFFEFINNYRVEEAKRLLRDPNHQHLNITAIGFESGFNSVSAFNSVFKKLVNVTPSQFRDSAKV